MYNEYLFNTLGINGPDIYPESSTGGIVVGDVNVDYFITRAYFYEATGGISVYGCSHYSHHKKHVTKYHVGDLVYIVSQARLGVLERIAIKEVKVFPTLTAPLAAGGWKQGNTPLYKDTLNSLYNEDDLCDFETAESLVQTYNDLYEAQLQWIVQHC